MRVFSIDWGGQTETDNAGPPSQPTGECGDPTSAQLKDRGRSDKRLSEWHNRPISPELTWRRTATNRQAAIQGVPDQQAGANAQHLRIHLRV